MTVGFGLERLGLLSLRFPRLALLLVAAVSLAFVAGLTQLKFNSDIRELFKSGSEDFAALERMTEQFPGSEHDILVLVEGAELFRPDVLESLRDLHLELRFVEGVRDVLSMFAARRLPTGTAVDSLVFPNDLSSVEDIEALKAEVGQHPLIKNKLLSSDSSLVLFVVALDGEQSGLAEVETLVGRILSSADGALKGSGLKASLTGFPVMRVEIIGALKRDQMVFIGAGFGLAVLLSWLLLARLRDVVIVSAPPVISTLGLLGSMWLRGQEINILTNGLPALVMVIAFSDSLHLMFAVRGKRGNGLPMPRAVSEAVREVGPACVLTSLTTAIALSTLAWVDNPLIAGFGVSAAFGTLIALAATLMTFPALAILLLAGEGERPSSPTSDPAAQRAIGRLSRAIAGLVLARPRALAGAGVAVFAVTATVYWMNQPHYLYRDYLPGDNPVFAAMERIDRELSGTSTIRVHLQWPPGEALYTEETLAVVSEAHQLVAAFPLVKETWSIETLSAWFAEAGFGPDDVAGHLDGARSDLIERMASPDSRAMLVTGQFVDTDSADLVPLLDELKAGLSEIRRDHPDVEISLTGISPVAARMSVEMIDQLNWSLLSAIAIIVVLLGVALRSVSAAAASILPNLLPIAAAGTYLYVVGAGLQFTAVVAFTLGFGIAVDSTIHVLNRHRLCRAAGRDPSAALGETLAVVGPVLIVSTLVLVAGLGVTMLSEMPSIRLYGRLCVIVISVSLIGALLFLPAILHCVAPAGEPGETET